MLKTKPLKSGNALLFIELKTWKFYPSEQANFNDWNIDIIQQNLTQIDIESEFQYIFKPCQDKAEYNRSIKLLDTSGMVSLEEATRRSINTVFAQVASELGGEKLASTAKRIGINSELDLDTINIENHDYTNGEFNEKMTISIGMGQYPKDSEDSRGLIRFADEKMYEVKKMGGNMAK